RAGESLANRPVQLNNQISITGSLPVFTSGKMGWFSLWGSTPAASGGGMRQVKNPRPSRQFKRVRWDELKHAWLYSEIERAVADRRPSEARDEVELRELTKRLPEMQAAEHRKYTSLVVAEMKRELRICRDEYHKYLERINAESRTAKWKVALEFEVAPRASRRLSQEATAYLRDAHVDETVFDFLFLSGGLPIIEPAS